MSDISQCLNKTCPLKEKCYRYTAIPNDHWQSYMDYKYNEETKSCDSFWDNVGRK